MSNTSLQKVRELWPGYLNKSLAADDQAFMDHWIHTHGPEHPEFQHELNWLALTRQQLRQATPQIDPEAGWHELLARIDAQPKAHAAPLVEKRPSLLAMCLSWLSSPALATSLAVLAVVQSLALWMVWPSESSVRLMSSAAPSASQASASPTITLQIAFHDKATVAQVRAALSSVNAQLTQGPSALGIWQAQVPVMSAPALQSLVVKLQSQAAVESVAIAQ